MISWVGTLFEVRYLPDPINSSMANWTVSKMCASSISGAIYSKCELAQEENNTSIQYSNYTAPGLSLLFIALCMKLNLYTETCSPKDNESPLTPSTLLSVGWTCVISWPHPLSFSQQSLFQQFVEKLPGLSNFPSECCSFSGKFCFSPTFSSTFPCTQDSVQLREGPLCSFTPQHTLPALVWVGSTGLPSKHPVGSATFLRRICQICFCQ